MNKLIKLVVIIANVWSMLNLAGCGCVESKPDDVVLEVLKALQKGKADSEFLNNHCTAKATDKFLEHEEKLQDQFDEAQFSVVSTVIDDDVAVVKIKVKDITKEGSERETEKRHYTLKKIDGHWKLLSDEENACGNLCISQKSVTVCVEAFKAAILKDDDGKTKERFTNECWDELQDEMGKASAKYLARLQDAIQKIEIIEHKKSALDDYAIEVACEMHGNSNGRLILKMHDGKWKIAKID